MTPQERDLVAKLFDRLASLENAPRDPEAERAIADELRRAPHAVYALVQTVLVQDEALKRADAHIRDLEAGLGEQAPAGFLDNMRATVFGRDDRPRGSVPAVAPANKWNSGQTGIGAAPMPSSQPYPQSYPSGGSFLGTAASAAAGVIAGSLLFDGIRSLMGNHSGAAFADQAHAAEDRSPWTGDASNSDLARDAGINDIGHGSAPDDSSRSAGLFGSDAPDSGDAGFDGGGDFGSDA